MSLFASARPQFPGIHARRNPHDPSQATGRGRASFCSPIHGKRNLASKIECSRSNSPFEPLSGRADWPTPIPSPEDDAEFSHSVLDGENGYGEKRSLASSSQRPTEKPAMAETTELDENGASTPPSPPPIPPLLPPRSPYSNPWLTLALWKPRLSASLSALFKSELRRRVTVTLLLLFLSRAGHFVPLPGFDPALAPKPLPAFDLAISDATAPSLPLSLFALGISPMIAASTLLQVAMAFKLFPSLNQLKEEGATGQKSLKEIIRRISFAIALVMGLVEAFTHRSMALLPAGSPARGFYLCTALFLAVGSTLYESISEGITAFGIGEGTTLLVCVSILTSYSDSLSSMLLSLRGLSPPPLSLLSLAIFSSLFLLMTSLAATLTTAQQTIPIVCFDLESPSGMGDDSSPSPTTSSSSNFSALPFRLIPSGMMPVFSASILLSLLGLVAKNLSASLSSSSASPSLPSFGPNSPGLFGASYFALLALLIVFFNYFEMEDSVTEMCKHLTAIGAQLPNVRPGRDTAQQLRAARDGTKLFGGLLLALLTLLSSLVDRVAHSFLPGANIGFTSMLIIVGSIMSLKRSVEAYQQIPQLQKVMQKYRMA